MGSRLLEAQSREGPWSLKPFTLQMEKRSPQKDRANLKVNYQWFSAHERVCVFQEGLALTQFTSDKTVFVTRTTDNNSKLSALAMSNRLHTECHGLASVLQTVVWGLT